MGSVHFWCIFLGTKKAHKIDNQFLVGFIKRKERDSNPRYSCPYTAFRVRPVRPLRHLSFGLASEVSPQKRVQIYEKNF